MALAKRLDALEFEARLSSMTSPDKGCLKAELAVAWLITRRLAQREGSVALVPATLVAAHPGGI